MRKFAACLCLLNVLATELDAQTTKVTRFQDPEGITADPTGLLRDHTVLAFPKYPLDLELAEITGAPVIAFVIDTTGRVELKTATFLNRPRPEFAKAVCDVLPRLQFQPFLVADRKWRVLLVQMYAFTTLAVPDTARRLAASTLAAQSQEDFATKPIANVIEQLMMLPHCDSVWRP